jgi:DnaK suppressor protein
MPTNPEVVLREKQQELQADLARLENEAREAGEPEVRDTSDDSTADQGVAETVDEISLKSQTLEEVEDALKRVADGTYGKCVVCGRKISPARLEAIPWTPYCLEDQEKQAS